MHLLILEPLKHIVIILVFLKFTVEITAQGLYSRKNNDAFPSSLQYHLGGWHFAPGFTYTFPSFFYFPYNDGQNYLRGKGKFGAYIELGRYRILEYSLFFKYLDYGIAYKSLRGRGSLNNNFGDHFISVFLNLNKTWKISDVSFIQNTIGLNGDYAFIRNVISAPAIPVFQLHYKFGFGFKIGEKTLCIPSRETPVLNIFPWGKGRSTLLYNNGRYRPIVMSIRFLFFREIKEKKCIKVPAPDLPDGYKMPTDMDNQ